MLTLDAPRVYLHLHATAAFYFRLASSAVLVRVCIVMLVVMPNALHCDGALACSMWRDYTTL